MISKISSENSILRSEVQKKSERIEKQSESDLVLKENGKLKQQNEELAKNEKKAREQAEATVTAVLKSRHQKI